MTVLVVSDPPPATSLLRPPGRPPRAQGRCRRRRSRCDAVAAVGLVVTALAGENLRSGAPDEFVIAVAVALHVCAGTGVERVVPEPRKKICDPSAAKPVRARPPDHRPTDSGDDRTLVVGVVAEHRDGGDAGTCTTPSPSDVDRAPRWTGNHQASAILDDDDAQGVAVDDEPRAPGTDHAELSACALALRPLPLGQGSPHRGHPWFTEYTCAHATRLPRHVPKCLPRLSVSVSLRPVTVPGVGAQSA